MNWLLEVENKEFEYLFVFDYFLNMLLQKLLNVVTVLQKLNHCREKHNVLKQLPNDGNGLNGFLYHLRSEKHSCHNFRKGFKNSFWKGFRSWGRLSDGVTEADCLQHEVVIRYVLKGSFLRYSNIKGKV